jgi:macrolide transport system ATP-binding/permease protein
MNVLGCLDVPSDGRYSVAGQAVAGLAPDELATLRRERFGFIFQRYHLLAHQDAVANVEMPAIYAQVGGDQRRSRAQALLTRLGLGERMTHKPNALSGGQQQRVSIARALMNGGEIILADEPTGALDSASGREMMNVLHELHARGHTVILVTHDAQVAAHAPRVVELRDGVVLRDTGWPADAPRAQFAALPAGKTGLWASLRGQAAKVSNAVAMSLQSLRGHRLRTALSTLGISIGIAAVVSIMALSDAARASVDGKLREMLSGRLLVMRGNVKLPAGAFARPFDAGDLDALRALPKVTSVVPQLQVPLPARLSTHNTTLFTVGSAPGFIFREGLKLAEGRDITPLDVALRAQVVVLSHRAKENLAPAPAKALGQVVMIGSLPFTVVGVTAEGGNFANNGWQTNGYVPDSTFGAKLTGKADVEQISVYVDSGQDPVAVKAQLVQVLKVRHGLEDFNLFSLDDEFQKINKVMLSLKLVLSAIAGISLLVGGVGVMNIMLVSVSERTPEIGIRMAVGARQADVQLQFLIESIVLCCAGGFIGVVISWLVASAINLAQQDLKVVVSWAALGLAFGVASAIGVTFGFMPARQASRLSPVQALARE